MKKVQVYKELNTDNEMSRLNSLEHVATMEHDKAEEFCEEENGRDIYVYFIVE